MPTYSYRMNQFQWINVLGEDSVHRRQTLIHANILSNVSSVGRRVEAGNLCQLTTDTGGESLRQLAMLVDEPRMQHWVAYIRRGRIGPIIAQLLKQLKPATAHNRYRGLLMIVRRPVDEGEVKGSLWNRTKPPQLPEALSDLLRDDQLKALLATCDKGSDRWCNEEE